MGQFYAIIISSGSLIDNPRLDLFPSISTIGNEFNLNVNNIFTRIEGFKAIIMLPLICQLVHIMDNQIIFVDPLELVIFKVIGLIHTFIYGIKNVDTHG